MNELKIDNEFRDLIPPLSIDERHLLKTNIIKEGCRDPIVLWNETILDGHNRYAICIQNGLAYKTANVEIANRNEAINWIIDNQLGKRNLPQRVKTYLIGKRYTNEKKAHGGDRKSEEYIEESKGQNVPLVSNAEKIAEQNKINEKTVKRNESFSESIDTLAESSGESAMDILTKVKLTQEDANKVATFTLETQKEIVRKVMDGELKSFKVALQPIEEEEKAQKVKEELEKHPDTDYCVYIPFYPTKSEIKQCPCGCGYGFCIQDNKWYTPEQIDKMREEPKRDE